MVVFLLPADGEESRELIVEARMREPTPNEVHTSSITTVAALASLVLGLIGFIVAHSTHLLGEHEYTKLVISHVSALLVATVPLALLWEKLTRRVFLAEIRSQLSRIVGIRETQGSIDSAGLTGLELIADFQGAINWGSYFRGAREIDIFFSYGRTWRRSVAAHIKDVAADSDFRTLRLFLPDPEDRDVMDVLARRFSAGGQPVAGEELAKRVIEAAGEFERLFADVRPKLKIFFHRVPLMYSAYRFDNRAVFALFRHRPERELPIPVLYVSREGSLFSFLLEELEAVAKISRNR